MTVFQHKTLPITITYSEYSKLSETDKRDFIIVNQNVQSITHNTTTTNIKNETKDLLGIGSAVETVVLAPLVVGAAIFKLFD